VVNLIHTLNDLTAGSCLSSISNVANPADLTFTAITGDVGGGAGANVGYFISNLINNQSISQFLPGDMWEAFKFMLCAFTTYAGFLPCENVRAALNFNANAFANNTRAQNALKIIEGPSGSQGCGSPYVYSNPIPLQNALLQTLSTITTGMNNQRLNELWNQNFWDLLVGSFCAEYGFILCPAIDRAIIAADLPGYNGANPLGKVKTIKTIQPDEYALIDQSAMLPRPLRAVVVSGSFQSFAGGLSEPASGGCSSATGIFAPSTITDNAGTILYQAIPGWLQNLPESGLLDVTGNPTNTAISTSTTPNAPKQIAPNNQQTPLQMISNVQNVLNNYAQMVYVRESLRGRGGTISGKLRFDIAPGSQVHLLKAPDQFIGAGDALATDLYAQVNRVTIEINAESRRAATSFGLTNLRNSTENSDPRTSASAHPLYGSSTNSGVILGFPLVAAYDL
jgi:hypothetical protein